MAQQIKYLLCRNEDLSSNPKTSPNAEFNNTHVQFQCSYSGDDREFSETWAGTHTGEEHGRNLSPMRWKTRTDT